MIRKQITETLDYLENERTKFAGMIKERKCITYADLTSTLYGLTGAMYMILDHIRRKERY